MLLPLKAVETFPLVAKEGYKGSSKDFQDTSCADNSQHLHARDSAQRASRQDVTQLLAYAAKLDWRAHEVSIETATPAASAEQAGRAAAAVSTFDAFCDTIGRSECNCRRTRTQTRRWRTATSSSPTRTNTWPGQ